MYSVQTSTLKLTQYLDDSLTNLPTPIVLNTIEYCGNDLHQLNRGIELLYQVLCRSEEVLIESENDERLLQQFVEKFQAMDLLTFYTASNPLFTQTATAAIELLMRIRSGHIILELL